MQDNLIEKKMIAKIINNIILENDTLKNDSSEFPKLTSFDIKSGFSIANIAKDILEKEPAVLQINTRLKGSDFIIVGDIHGNLDSLIRIFKEKGYPPKKRYLFLGDYIDRGKCSCEVIILLYALKCLFPKDVFMTRGNHEFPEMTDFYGFKTECMNRIDNISVEEEKTTGIEFYNLIIESFSNLPICAIINDSIFCVHGGITSLIKSRKDLLKIKKVGSQFTSNELPQEEMLWNDPDKSITSYKFSGRGRGMVFGEHAVKVFLRDLNFKLIIRAHQETIKGFEWPFGPKGGIVTIFGSIDYLKLHNNSAIAIVSKDPDSNQLINIETFKKYPKFDAVYYVFTYPFKNRDNY